jgi:hypothetical protein
MNSEHDSSILAGKSPNVCRRIPNIFLCFTAGNGRKATGKNQKNSRPEYCFHVPSISGVFLQDPVTCPPLSVGIRSFPEVGIIDLGESSEK